MQSTLTLTATDGTPVTIEVNSRQSNTAAVLCLHGFTGHINNHLWYNAAQVWPGKGFDTWRLALYPGGKGRSMKTITWEQNLSDAHLTLAEMRKKYKAIFIVGHSLGGTLAVNIADASIKGLVLWDPPYQSSNEKKAQTELHPDFYTLDKGSVVLVPKTYANEIIEITHYKNITQLPCPTYLIRSLEPRQWPQDRLPLKPKVIRNSNHTFDRDGNEKAVFGHTIRFMRECLGE